ncbi:gluconeogenesis factor YvcK family protein [Aspergillus undulatus]|uniref:gluconeogenesis factor YvcK family protein n=1 Tax=Aspergillus undulatus TaxID=1810928 RepID=UPI003CCDABCE
MSSTPSAPNRGLAVFSGGSAANNLVDVFDSVRESKKCSLSYIIPISDNGGSSSELIRIFGGPGIGDVRSRLVRLIPPSPPNSERAAIKALFNHRLSADNSAHSEWLAIVDGTSVLWSSITPAKKELIRSFFNLLNLEILKRARPPASTFDFSSASVGNLFLTGARLFSGSFESAIYLLSNICDVPSDLIRVIPAINSNFSHHISASLANGTIIVGQNSISHPSLPPRPASPRPKNPLQSEPDEPSAIDYTEPSDVLDTALYEDDQPPGFLPHLRNKNINFSKSENEDLPARITRVWYINPYGQEIRPRANPRVLESLRDAQAIIYSIGSLYTSLIPSLVLQGVGQAIVSSPARHKILILNGSLDRETGPPSDPFSAVDFIEAITRAGEESRGRIPLDAAQVPSPQPSASTSSASDTASSSNPDPDTSTNTESFPTIEPIPQGLPYTSYVTHVLHLEGPGTPHVDKDRLAEMGIETLRLYGRKIVSSTGGSGSDAAIPIGMRYDSNGLIQALEVVLGKKGDGMLRGAVSRRNTLDPGRKRGSRDLSNYVG